MTLRTYGYMRRRSLKVQQADPGFQAVYRLVDQRSEGRCEFLEARDPAEWGPAAMIRCPRAASDHHPVGKPRRRHHTAELIVHLCRAHHDRCEWPYHRGRLAVTAKGDGVFTFALHFLSAKRAAPQPKAGP